jgi:hypothetical protein
MTEAAVNYYRERAPSVLPRIMRRRPHRSCPCPSLRRSLGQLVGACDGITFADKQAVMRAFLAPVRRSPTSTRSAGTPPSGAAVSRAALWPARDACHIRRARRRSRRDRLRLRRSPMPAPSSGTSVSIARRGHLNACRPEEVEADWLFERSPRSLYRSSDGVRISGRQLLPECRTR